MSQLTPGKLALVTGGGRGIGRATCEVLAREGASVIAADINETGAKETVASLPGNDHFSIHLDVSNYENVKAAIQTIIQKYGSPPTIVVNCAGIAEIHPFLLETQKTFQRTIDINLKGTFTVTQEVCKELIQSNLPGSIVNIVSMVGHRGYTGYSPYAASKLGLEGITRCIAKDMSGFNIRCNAVQPGLISSPMGNGADETFKTEWCNGLATKRMGTPHVLTLKIRMADHVGLLIALLSLSNVPDVGRFLSCGSFIYFKMLSSTLEVAEVIVFIASDRSSYINGAIIPVTGGM